MSRLLKDAVNDLLVVNSRTRWKLSYNHREVRLVVHPRHVDLLNELIENRGYFQHQVLEVPSIVNGFKLVGVKTRNDRFSENVGVILSFERDLLVSKPSLECVERSVEPVQEGGSVTLAETSRMRSKDPVERFKRFQAKVSKQTNQIPVDLVRWIGDTAPPGYVNARGVDEYNQGLWKRFVEKPSRRAWFHSYAKDYLDGKVLMVQESWIPEHVEKIRELLQNLNCNLVIYSIKGD